MDLKKKVCSLDPTSIIIRTKLHSLNITTPLATSISLQRKFWYNMSEVQNWVSASGMFKTLQNIILIINVNSSLRLGMSINLD